ncbi:dimethyladenosine transferase 2, mitochondrial-like [Gigantopelta aegis]|uniref:dimethyladenosine transferase 2, mitochondrial-like n=1 Tax=Gigantopelta aegis TaxID=1735272 RepID=UPI001B888046|nr:dimethyladenosine transferase 2, mitochondrial-like [Gigantopelta aegis]
MTSVFSLSTKPFHLWCCYAVFWNNCYRYTSSRLFIKRQCHDSKLTGLMQNSEYQDDSTNYQTITSAKIRSSHYILDKSLAASVASVIIKNRSSQNSSVLEINPGPGILTKELFSKGVHHIVATDTKEQLLSLLERNLQREISQHKLHCFHWDCFTLWHRDTNSSQFEKDYRDKEVEIVAAFQQKTHGDEIPITAFGVVSYLKERPFLNYILHNFGLLEGIFSLGRLEWFLFVSAKIYKTVLASTDHDKSVLAYNTMSVLLHLLFDIKCHMEVSGNEFSPPFQNIKRKKREIAIGKQLVKYDMKYLLQMKPKENWDSVLPALEIFKFSLFLKQLFHKKRMRLIPKMEQLVPGCGLHLILAGYTMVQEVGETSPEQFLQIYNDMQTWPEYQDSGLHFYLMEHAVHGMEEEAEGGDSVTEKSSVWEESSS